MSEKLSSDIDSNRDVSVEDDPLAELARIVAGEPEPVLETHEPEAPALEDQSFDDAVQISDQEFVEALMPDDVAPAPQETVAVDTSLEDALAAELQAQPIAYETEPPAAAQDITHAVDQVIHPTIQEPQPAELDSPEAPVAADASLQGEPEVFEDSLISALQDELSDQPAPAAAAAPAAIMAEPEPTPVEQAGFEESLSAELDGTAAAIENVAQEISAELPPVAQEEPFEQPAPQPASELSLEEDLGAAFDKEFEQIMANDTAVAPQVEEIAAHEQPDFEPQLKSHMDPMVDTIAVDEPVVEASVDSMPPQPASVQELDFGSAFAEELGVDAIAEKDGWDTNATETANAEFAQAAQPDFGISVDEDPGHDGYVPGVPNEAELAAQQDVEAKGGSQRYAIAALVLALFAGTIVAGYGFLGGGDAGPSSEPVVIKADSDPVKVKPEDPGGRVVANQDKETFNKVAGDNNEEINQESLISETEEPAQIDAPKVTEVATNLPKKTDERLNGGEVETAGNGQATANVQPRVVQTVTVKPDGTIINEAPKAIGTVVDNTVELASNAVNSVSDAVVETTLLPATTVETNVIAKPEPIDGAQTSGQLAVPAASPLPKPVVKAQPKPVQVAAAKPKPAAAAPVRKSEWVVQVSSQRSADAAQASYQNLKGKFGVLQGRPMSIQRANVNGSTFYRVRVQTASKSDANQLCSSLKSSGGSCFVTR